MVVPRPLTACFPPFPRLRAASHKKCTPLEEYFSPLGSFTIFKAMLERTAAVTNDGAWGCCGSWQALNDRQSALPRR